MWLCGCGLWVWAVAVCFWCVCSCVLWLWLWTVGTSWGCVLWLCPEAVCCGLWLWGVCALCKLWICAVAVIEAVCCGCWYWVRTAEFIIAATRTRVSCDRVGRTRLNFTCSSTTPYVSKRASAWMNLTCSWWVQKSASLILCGSGWRSCGCGCCAAAAFFKKTFFPPPPFFVRAAKMT